MRRRVRYDLIGSAALRCLPLIVARWLPNGRREGHEWVALNPKRNDRQLGSFKINLKTGQWADFATGDKGGDVISLAAYLHGLSQPVAARKVAEMLDLTRERVHDCRTCLCSVGNSGSERTRTRERPVRSVPITPVPEDRRGSLHHPRFGVPVATWEYRDREGRLLGYTARFEVRAKADPASHLVPTEDGRKLVWKSFAAPGRCTVIDWPCTPAPPCLWSKVKRRPMQVNGSSLTTSL